MFKVGDVVKFGYLGDHDYGLVTDIEMKVTHDTFKYQMTKKVLHVRFRYGTPFELFAENCTLVKSKIIKYLYF